MAKINIWNDNQFDGDNNFNYRLFFDEITPDRPDLIVLAKYTQDKNIPEEKWIFPLISKDYVDVADELLQSQIDIIDEEIETDYCKLIETEIGFSTDFNFDGTYEVNFVITVNKGSLHVEIPMTGYAFKKGDHVRVNANRSGYAGNGIGSCVAIYNSDIGTLKVYAIVSRDVYNAEGTITWSLSDQTGIKVTDGELLGLTIENVEKTVNDDMDVYTIIRKNGDNVNVSIETITPQVYRDKIEELETAIERVDAIFTLRGAVETYADLPTENVFDGDIYIVKHDENFDPEQVSLYTYVAGTSEWEYLARLSIDIDLYLTEEESDERYATIIQKIFSDFPTNSVIAYQGTVEQCLSFLFYQFSNLNTRFNNFATDTNNELQTIRNLVNNIGLNGNVAYNDETGAPVRELLNTAIQKLFDRPTGGDDEDYWKASTMVEDFDDILPADLINNVRVRSGNTTANIPWTLSNAGIGIFIPANAVSTLSTSGTLIMFELSRNTSAWVRTCFNNIWGDWKRLDDNSSSSSIEIIRKYSMIPTPASGFSISNGQTDINVLELSDGTEIINGRLGLSLTSSFLDGEVPKLAFTSASILFDTATVYYTDSSDQTAKIMGTVTRTNATQYMLANLSGKDVPSGRILRINI